MQQMLRNRQIMFDSIIPLVMDTIRPNGFDFSEFPNIRNIKIKKISVTLRNYDYLKTGF